MSFVLYLFFQMPVSAPTVPTPPVFVPICLPGHPKCNRPAPAPQQRPIAGLRDNPRSRR